MSSDDMNNPIPEDQDAPTATNRLLSVEQSRRKFLRTAVIGTAGVAGAAGVAGIVLSQHGASPNLLTIAALSGVSSGDYTMLFEDTECGTSGHENLCGDYSSTNFTVVPNAKHPDQVTTNPGSFFVVLAIRSLPADTYSIVAKEKLSTDASFTSTIPHSGSGSASLPFAYQSNGSNVQIYRYPTGTINSNGPYALTSAQYSGYLTPVPGLSYADSSSDTFTTSSTYDVLIFIHVNWEGGNIPGGTGATKTIDFQITLTDSSSNSVVETCSTTGVEGS